MRLNVRDFATPEDAIAAASPGDRIYFPNRNYSGTANYYAAPAGGYQIKKPLEIYGDGPGDPSDSSGTAFTASGTSDVFVVTPTANLSYVYFHDFKIHASANNRHGISCSVGTGQIVSAIRLERVNVYQMADTAFRFVGVSLDLNGFIESLSIVDCGASFCNYGLWAKFVLCGRVFRSTFGTNNLGAVFCDSSALSLYNVGSDTNSTQSGTPQGHVLFQSCKIALVDACFFEKFQTERKIACEFRECGGAAQIGASYFTVESGIDGCTGILATPGTNPVTVTVLPNRLTRSKPMLDIRDGVLDAVVLPQFNDNVGGPFGTILLPGATTPNLGLLSAPTIRRPELQTQTPCGLILPSASEVPVFTQDGMLFYYTTGSGALLLQAGGTWHTLTLTT